VRVVVDFPCSVLSNKKLAGWREEVSSGVLDDSEAESSVREVVFSPNFKLE